MLKAEELRIGNFVQNEKGKVSVWDLWDFAYIQRDNPIEYIPIPLTEEWLEKFGFEKDAIRIYRIQLNSVNKFLVIPFDEENEARIEMPFGNGIMTIAKNIHFVHQLQNLYFALTGEELMIKKIRVSTESETDNATITFSTSDCNKTDGCNH